MGFNSGFKGLKQMSYEGDSLVLLPWVRV